MCEPMTIATREFALDLQLDAMAAHGETAVGEANKATRDWLYWAWLFAMAAGLLVKAVL